MTIACFSPVATCFRNTTTSCLYNFEKIHLYSQSLTHHKRDYVSVSIDYPCHEHTSDVIRDFDDLRRHVYYLPSFHPDVIRHRIAINEKHIRVRHYSLTEDQLETSHTISLHLYPLTTFCQPSSRLHLTLRPSRVYTLRFHEHNMIKQLLLSPLI